MADLGTIGHVADPRERADAWMCKLFFIGHKWVDDTPAKLLAVNSPHARVRCVRCMIQRWRFQSDTQEGLEEIMGVANGKANRAGRRLTRK